MQLRFTLLITLLAFTTLSLSAQNRYLDPIFEVSGPEALTYGQNVDVFLQGLNQLDAEMYQPVGDDSTELRPVVVVYPTGNFLIQFLNQGPYGSLRDSAAVEIINQVVSRGYVGMVAEYRSGWLPTATVQDIRTSSLLEAAYRGGQDAHTMARYLRKTVVEDGNPMRIDTNRIVFWGLGTGGYVTMTHAFLDDIDEVLDDDRFYDVMDEPYVDININADPKGLLPAAFENGSPSNIPNWVGYNSDVAMAINTGGALGDLDWMTGADNEPITLGYHSPTDPFAPFSNGTVVVPTTGDVVISGVSGTEAIVEKANELGINDAIASANATDLGAPFSQLSLVVNLVNAQYKPLDVDLRALGQDSMVDLSHDNMFPLSVGDRSSTPTTLISSPFNWIDTAQVRVAIGQFNAATGQTIDADAVIDGEFQTNPNTVNPAGARLSIDTMMAHFLPRAYIGMNLGDLVSTEEIVAPTAIGFQIAPNPAGDFVRVSTERDFPIRELALFDVNGRQLRQVSNVNQLSYRLDRNGLPNGTYLVRLRVDEGVATKVVFFR